LKGIILAISSTEPDLANALLEQAGCAVSLDEPIDDGDVVL